MSKQAFIITARLRHFGFDREYITAETKEEAESLYRASVAKWTVDSLHVWTREEYDKHKEETLQAQALADAEELDGNNQQ